MKSPGVEIKRFYQQIRKSEFTKNSLVLLGGTVISQLIPIGISPILTRLYSPAEFGILALFVSVAKIISVFSTGRYEPAIVLPEKESDALNLMALSLLLATAVSLALFFVVAIFKEQILELLNAPLLGNWLFLVPVSAWFLACGQVLFYWLSRKKEYKSLSVGRVFQGVSVAGVQLSKVNGALIIGNLTGQVVMALNYLWVSKKYFLNLNQVISKAEIKKNMVLYKKFPLVTSLHRFFDLIQSNVLISLISSLFSTSVLGFYSLTTKTLLAPSALVGSVVSNVFYQRASELFQQKQLILPLVQKVLLVLLVIALPSFIGLYFFAADLFAFVFGEEWREGGTYTQILTPWLFLTFLSSPLSGIVNIMGKQQLFFVISAIGNTLAVSSFCLLGLTGFAVEHCLMAFSGAMTVYILVYMGAIYRSIQTYDNNTR